ncbi:MAG: cell wall-binding repeat-containing protein [Actinobacteria bacterium]|nr:cell wall-binding repeat-containing protein [Actinomycetota bacterium]
MRARTSSRLAPGLAALVTVGLVLVGVVPVAAETRVDAARGYAPVGSAALFSEPYGSCGQIVLDTTGTVVDVLTRPDGSTVLAVARTSGDVLVALTATGESDTDLGNSDGLLARPFGTLASGERAVVGGLHEVGDGTLLVVGAIVDSDDEGDVAVARFRADGARDTSFDDDGIVRHDLGGDERGAAIGAVFGSAPVVAGTRDGEVLVASLTTDGALEPAFDDDGWATAETAAPTVADLVVVFDSRIIVTGSTGAVGERDWFLAGWEGDGTPLPGGLRIRDLGGDDVAFGAAQASGPVTFGVTTFVEEVPETRLFGYDPDLQAEASFGDGGMVVVAPRGQPLEGGGLAATGRVLAVSGRTHLLQGSGPLSHGVGVATFRTFDGVPNDTVLAGSPTASERFDQPVAAPGAVAFRGDSIAPLVAVTREDGRVVVLAFRDDLRVDAASGCPEAAEHLVDRLWGGDRYLTAAAISADAFAPGVDLVYVATGLDFPDALSVSPVAGRTRRPILLVRQGEIPEATATELTRLRPGAIVVLGGEVAVSRTVFDFLAAYTDGAVTRIAGGDRYETAAKTSSAAFPDGAEVVYLATGENFPDALAGGATAGVRGAPVLLTRRESLPNPTRVELKRLRPGEVIVLGGKAAVSDDVVSEVAGIIGSAPKRLAGDDRIGTAAAVADDTFEAPFSPRDRPFEGTTFLATGANFPDALAGGALAAVTGGPLLLVTSQRVPEQVRLQIARLDARRVVLLGGESVVTPDVESDLARAGGTDHAFLNLTQNGDPVRYDPCSPIPWVFNPDHAPANGLEDVKEGFARISAVSGLDFVYEGETDEPVNAGGRPLVQPDRYGNRWAPVLVGWTPNLGPTGLGGSAYGPEGVYVTGGLALNASDTLPSGYGPGGTWGDVIVHEMGHMLGLDHVGDVREIMFPVLLAGDAEPPAFVFGDGSELGLRVLATGCLDTPDPFLF